MLLRDNNLKLPWSSLSAVFCLDVGIMSHHLKPIQEVAVRHLSTEAGFRTSVVVQIPYLQMDGEGPRGLLHGGWTETSGV